MKEIDVRFSSSDMDMIKSMIGKKMEAYKCNLFEFSTSVYGIIGIRIEGDAFAFTNLVEVMDYFGTEEDVAIFKVKRMPYETIHSMVRGVEMIETPVESVITGISVINEHQRLFKENVQIYDVWVTRGIIFKLADGREVSLEKNIWFSEEISVERGYDLIQRFSPEEEFVEGWSGEYCGECSREIVEIAKE